MKHTDIKKIVLAYSGGLDTSIIIPVSYTHLDVYKRQAYSGGRLTIRVAFPQ